MHIYSKYYFEIIKIYKYQSSFFKLIKLLTVSILGFHNFIYLLVDNAIPLFYKFTMEFTQFESLTLLDFGATFNSLKEIILILS